MRSHFLLFLLLLLSYSVFGQTISGRIIDKSSEEGVPYARIYLPDLTLGVLADSAGYFRLDERLPNSLQLQVSALGYDAAIISLNQSFDEPVLISLEPCHLELEEVEISQKTGFLKTSSIANVESKSIGSLQSGTFSNMGSAMTRIPGVYQISSGAGMSKPVIRGMSGSRVITYLEGLRIENQQWGGDHGLGLSENGIKKVEVIKGPASLMYGADALGGVIYLVDQSYTHAGQIEAFAESRFESVNLRTDNYLGLKLAGKKLRFNLFGNYNSAADFSLPSGDFVKDSRFSGITSKASLGYSSEKWVFNMRYNFSQNKIGIPGHTHESNPGVEDYVSSFQNRNYRAPAQFISNHYLLTENMFFLPKSDLKLWVGYTSNRLREYEEVLTEPALDMGLANTSYTIRWRRPIIDDKTNIILGAQGMYQIRSNSAESEEQIVPEGNSLDNGVFALINTSYHDWQFEAGLRGDIRRLHTRLLDSEEEVNRMYSSLNYSFGTSKEWERITFRASLSSGYRLPHTSELFADGIHHGNLRYEVGNPNLKSEKASQIDASLNFHGRHFNLFVNPYYSGVQNYIYLQPTDSSVAGYPVAMYEQAKRARLFGGESGFHFHPHFLHQLHIKASFSLLFSEDYLGNSLPLSPQNRVQTELKYDFEMKSRFALEYVSLSYLYHFQQNQVSALETASEGYGLLNLGISARISTTHPISIKAGIRNVLNTTYIDHLSRLKNLGLAGSGRSFQMGLRWDFSSTMRSKSE